MKTRSALIATVTSGVLALGGAGAVIATAFGSAPAPPAVTLATSSSPAATTDAASTAGAAAPTPAATPAPTPAGAPKACATAGDRLTRLAARDTKLQARVQTLQSTSHPKRQAIVNARISALQADEGVVNARMSYIEKTCGVSAPAAP